MDFQLPDYNIQAMLPELFLFLWALVVFAFDVVTKRKSETAAGYLSLFGIFVAGLLLWITPFGKNGGMDSIGFGSMFINDRIAYFFKIIFLTAAFMAVGSSFGIMKQKIVNHRGEFFGLMLLSTVGMMFLASSQELISLYIGLELTTIPLFVLAAFYKDNKLSVEAGLKYFVIGAFSSALLLFGMSFLYGMTGTTSMVSIRVNLAIAFISYNQVGFILLLANILLLAGIGFKISLPPFHQWAPDVYEGAPTPVAAFLSVGSKAAGLIAFAKIFVSTLYAFHGPEAAPNDWGMLTGVLAVAAMIIGNVVAIRQSDIKRMLAYSSIAQAGYIMVGMVAMGEPHGLSSVSYYMFAYLFANMGAFACVAIFEDKSGSTQISSYQGLSKTSPFFAASLSIFLMSLIGIPPLAGFMAKYKVFAAAISQTTGNSSFNWLYWLVGIGLITSVFALFYYANVIKQMYFSKEESPYKVDYSIPSFVVLVIGLVGVFLAGIIPDLILNFTDQITPLFGLGTF